MSEVTEKPLQRLLNKMNSLFFSTKVNYKLFDNTVHLTISDTVFEGVHYPALKYACDFLEANGYKAYWVSPTHTGRIKILACKATDDAGDVNVPAH